MIFHRQLEKVTFATTKPEEKSKKKKAKTPDKHNEQVEYILDETDPAEYEPAKSAIDDHSEFDMRW